MALTPGPTLVDCPPRRRQLAPENTLAAFRLGLQHGYRAFECDVKLTRDETSFLLHDDTLERTTNGKARRLMPTGPP